MKTLGIDINGNTAVFCSVEENSGIVDITGKMTKLELKDDENSQEVHEFVDVIHSHFNEMQFDKIAILKRAKSLKAKFPVSPISFKLEGLIQTYKESEIIFVAPQTISAFFKKNQKVFKPKFVYQNSAADLAYYLLKK
jgi:hypothetical protein